jgi:multiple antibiotic resistance protein
MNEVFQVWAIPLLSLVAIVDPVAAVPSFLAMTAADTPAHRRTIIRNACVAAVFLLAVFALGGRLIFKVFSITLPAFRIAGGIILGMTAFDMLRAQEQRATPDEIEEGRRKVEIAITPLAVPILAGPGALSTVMLMMGRATGIPTVLPVLVAIVATGLICYIVLRLSERVLAVMGRTGINLMSRLMGILLLTVSVQFVLDGLREVVADHLRGQ